MDIEDDDAVELSNDLRREIEEEEKRKVATSSDDDDDQEDSDDDSDDGDDGDSDDDVGASDDDSADDSDDDDSDDSDGDDPKLKKTDIPPVGKKTNKTQKRIEELAKKRREAEKAAFDAEMKALELERRLEAIEARASAAPAANTDLPREPKPDDFEYGEVDQKYIDAVVNYKVAKARHEDQQKNEQERTAAKNAERKAHYQKRLAQITDDGSKRTDLKDFDNIVNGVNFPGPVALAILDSDQAVDIAYYLGNNISKLREFSLMDPATLARNMGRLEERFSARASAGKKRSQAPETPGTRKSRQKAKVDESKYGPADQDAFDRAFFQR